MNSFYQLSRVYYYNAKEGIHFGELIGYSATSRVELLMRFDCNAKLEAFDISRGLAFQSAASRGFSKEAASLFTRLDWLRTLLSFATRPSHPSDHWYCYCS